MLPNNTLALYPVTDSFLSGHIATSPFSKVDYELGAESIGDPTMGLSYRLWTASINEYNRVVLTSANNTSQILIEVPENIKKLTFAFDQNMRPVIGYWVDEGIYLYWFDTVENDYVTTLFPDASSPALTLDERRPDYILNADVVFMYVSNGNLCYRLQRDRYSIEYVLQEEFNGQVIAIGTNAQYRLQISIVNNTYGSGPVIPSSTPMPSVTATVSFTPTPTVTTSITPTPAVTPTITPTITQTITPAITITPTPTLAPTITPTMTPAPSPTTTPAVTPTITVSPTISVTPSST